MLKQASGWIVLVGLSGACGSGGGAAQPDRESGSSGGLAERSSDAILLEEGLLEEGSPEESTPEDRAVRYQFVGTPEGMTVEAVSGTQVQTFSCPTRSCTGFCDECAARACEASGELAGACARLVRDCSDTCSCNQGQGTEVASCGFPVCALNRNLCYIGSSDDSFTPGGPRPDPNPTDPAVRPSSDPGSPSPSSATPSGATPSGATPSGATPSGATPSSNSSPSSAGTNISLPAG